jgi:hypothetical protein
MGEEVTHFCVRTIETSTHKNSQFMSPGESPTAGKIQGTAQTIHHHRQDTGKLPNYILLLLLNKIRWFT